MSKREPRLKFTDEERASLELGKAVRKAEKAAVKADKAQSKIPTKKVVKPELTADPKNGKIKVKLNFEDAQKKPPSRLTFAAQDAPGAVVRGHIHKEVSDTEDDNVGVESAHKLEETAEGAGHLMQEAHRSHQLQPHRAAARAENQLEKANVQALQKKAQVENPTSNPVSKWQQKQAIKRQYAAAKSGKTAETVKKTGENTAKAAKKAAEATEKAAQWVWQHKSPVRSCEDVDETALSYAEIKALCAGDPRIKEKMDLDIDVARLKLLKADHQSQQYRLEDNLLRYFPEQIEKFKAVIAAIETDIDTLKAHPHPEDGFAGMVVKGDRLTDKDNAGAALLEACKEAIGLEPVEIGSYRGFTMSVTLENFGKDYWVYLKGNLSYGVKLGGDARGNLTRIENELSDLSWRLNTNKQQLQNVYNQMDIAKAEIGKPFPQEAELRQKSARLTELNALLDMDGKGSKEPVVDGTIVAKSSRPSVLDKLKAPAVHGTPGKPHKIEKEAR